MEELQQQIVSWCVSLKDYLKCEQCQGKLSPDIYLCEAGHLVCSSCLRKTSTNVCTLCKLPFTRTRNYLAENLAQKMDDILEKIGVDNENDDLESICSESSTSWNIFPCWVGKCRYRGTPEDIRQHCRDSHRGLFETIIDSKFPITRSWNFDYSFPRTFNRFFDVTDLGLFLLHIIIYENGALRAYVFMYNSGRSARDHKYQLKVTCAGENLSFEGDVDCARIPRSQLAKKGLFIPRAQNLQVQLQNVQKFTVSVEVTKNLKNQENLPGEKVEKRNQHRNRKKTQKPRGNAQEKVESPANVGIVQKVPDEPQQKGPNKPNKNNNNNLPKNQQKTGDSDGKNNNQKQPIIEKSQDFHKNQSKVNNCLQTTDSLIFPKFVPTVDRFPQSPIPPLFPGAHPMSQQYVGNPRPNYSPPNFYQGMNPGPFNPHIPPPTPGPSAIYYNAPSPSSHNNQPSAPVEDHFNPVQYPDLTPMEQAMRKDRLDELQQKINEKERARQSCEVHYGEDALGSKRGAKNKDNCCIS